MKRQFSDVTKLSPFSESVKMNHWLWFFLYLAIFTGGYSLFTYNSGYGYDASEYLVIANSLGKKFDLYSMILSKSWGMYAYTYLALGLTGARFGHASVTALITFNAILVLTLLFTLMKEIYSLSKAWIAIWLVSLVFCFTEMNFLEPELLIGLCGLAGYWIANKSKQVDANCLFWAGLWIGCGMWFKVVAVFYLFGLACFILIEVLKKKGSFRQITKLLSLMAMGFAVPQILVALFFLITGRLSEHVEWTYLFPLRGYPANTYWLGKFFIKLFWFHFLLLWCVLLSLKKEIRGKVYCRPVWMALSLAMFSLIALAKTQASHYFFPSALFFSVYISVVLTEWMKLYLAHVTFPRLIPLGLILILIGVCGWLYRPDAIARLYTLRNYETELKQREFIQAKVPKDKHLLAISGGQQIYLIADRLPNVPFPHTDIQTTYYVSKFPDVLEKALEDESLKMVLYDNEGTRFDDPKFLETIGNRQALKRFESKLLYLYMPEKSDEFPYKYWLRKPLTGN